LTNPIEVNTANGPAFADHDVILQLLGMPEYVCATEMPDSPALLSVGRRCMKHGYSFVWMAGRDPYFITRDAAFIIPCTVRSGAPYLDPDDSKCEPCPPEHMVRRLVLTYSIVRRSRART
jgi:hypothetical protein